MVIGKTGYTIRKLSANSVMDHAVSIDGKIYKAKSLVNIEKYNPVKAIDLDGDTVIVTRFFPEDEIIRENWLYDGSYVERWEQGFRKKLYHGRTGAYFESESKDNIPFDKWTIPELVSEDNPLEPSPYNTSLRLINTKDGSTLDSLYIGFPKALFRGRICFEAKLPSTGDDIYIGFEVNSGGAFAGIACLWLDNNNWKLLFVSPETKLSGIGGGKTKPITLNRPDAWNRYVLEIDPPYMIFYQGTTSDPTVFDVVVWNPEMKPGKYIPFLANEDLNSIIDVRVGNIWVYETEPDKHVETIIDVASIPASGEVHSDLNLQMLKSIALTVRVTYGATATSGVTVYLLASSDGSNFDTENSTDAFYFFEPSFSAGQTRQKTVNIDSLPKYLRVLVRNKDASVATGAVKVNVHGVERVGDR